jgi:predicted amidohydrolase
MRLTMAQVRVERDVATNAAKIRSIVREARADEWVVFPEGAISGYFPQDESFLTGDSRPVTDAVDAICADARQRRCGLVLGSALYVDGAWRNSVIVQNPDGRSWRYDKIELSELDARHFTAGHELPVYETGDAALGIQVCRELLFPVAWHSLASDGARLIVHVNNAIKPIDAVWEHVIIARAVENGVFVCSVNNAAAPQALASYVVSPAGEVLAKTDTQTEQIVSCEIDLSAIRPAY